MTEEDAQSEASKCVSSRSRTRGERRGGWKILALEVEERLEFFPRPLSCPPAGEEKGSHNDPPAGQDRSGIGVR